jgi:hypothetical protein
VTPTGTVRLADEVKVDLKRYGVPKIDQHKMPLPPEGVRQPPPQEENPKAKKITTTGTDSVSTASKNVKSTPPPSRAKTQVRPRRNTR